MNKIQDMLLRILRLSIINDTPVTCEPIELTKDDFLKVYSEATAHSIDGVIVDTMKSVFTVSKDDNGLCDKIKRSYLLYAINLKKKQSDSHAFIKVFNDNEVNYVLLKGVALQQLYPNPITRKYGDVDILVDVKDLSKVEGLLKPLGYTRDPNQDASYHTHYGHTSCLPIEVHHRVSLVTGKNSKIFAVDDFFRAKTKIEAFGQEITILKGEERIIYNLTHLAKHLHDEGFGYRQLLDIHLLMLHGDWEGERLEALLESAGLMDFAKHLFVLSTRWFGGAYKIGEGFDEFMVSELAEFISESGVFGRKDNNHHADVILSKYLSDDTLENGASGLTYKLKLLFPAPKRLPTRYHYARKCLVLLPVAWIHRIIFEFLRKPGAIKNVLNASISQDEMLRHHRLCKKFGLSRAETIN